MKTRRKAVAPVIATLLMIAVAVAMSVIIFMWAQGFLSNTSSATGGQQGAQNQAAQSSISIEAGAFTAGAGGSITVIVRNVGAVSVVLGSLQVAGSSSNSGFTGHIIIPTLSSVTTTTSSTGVTFSSGTWLAKSNVNLDTPILRGAAVSITLNANLATTGTILTSGDVVNIKVTTTVGTFAQAQYTIP